MTNIEFKARIKDFTRVRQVLQQRGAHFAGVLHQTDTYFPAPHGRLKLREIQRRGPSEAQSEVRAQLIHYQRADEAGLKRSDYQIAGLDRAEDLRKALAAALGIRVVVRKHRELFLLGYEGTAADENEMHIRVHLDHVEELGDFIEVEALAGGGVSPAQAQQAAQALLQEFGVATGELIAGSYADLLLEKRG